MTGSRTDLPAPGTSLAAPTERALELQARMLAFLPYDVLPAEAESLAHRWEAGQDGHVVPPVIERLKASARGRVRPARPVEAPAARTGHPVACPRRSAEPRS